MVNVETRQSRKQLAQVVIQMLNHIHNNQLCNTVDGVQAMGEELSYMQMNKCGIHTGEGDKQYYMLCGRKQSSSHATTEQTHLVDAHNTFYQPSTRSMMKQYNYPGP